MAQPGARLAAALHLAVDSTLAKLKPAEKTAANKLYTAALADPPTPQEVNLLYAAWDAYHLEGITYRGQKTQETKVQAQIGRCLDAAEDFEKLGRVTALRQVWKWVEKLATAGRRRFPDNPYFPLLQAEAVFAKAGRMPPFWRVAGLLDDARRLADRSPEPRHKDLLPRIEELRKQVHDPEELFEFFFRGR
jgi:hypothetical protein